MTSSANGGIVLVTWPGFDTNGSEAATVLRMAGLDIRLAPKLGSRTSRELSALLAGCVGVVASTDPYDRSVLEATPSLRVIARVGVGIDSIDLEAATEMGVVVTITPGANGETVAEHTLALMLATVRRLVENDSSVRRGHWDRASSLTGGELRDKVVGLIGYGAIGRAVARRLDGFGVRVVVCDPAAEPAEGVEILNLEGLLELADIVSLHVPLLESTRELIGKEELARVKPGAILINTARGALLDEPSLVEALESGHLGAAGLDVFAEEPPRSTRLVSLPNVVLTPHIAGISIESIGRMLRSASHAVVDVLDGRMPHGVVNPESFDSRR